MVPGCTGAPYESGLLACARAHFWRLPPALPEPPDVLLVDATGRDHPRSPLLLGGELVGYLAADEGGHHARSPSTLRIAVVNH